MELGVLESGERGRRGDGAVPAVALGATKEVADPDAREAPAGEPLQPWDDDDEEDPRQHPDEGEHPRRADGQVREAVHGERVGAAAHLGAAGPCGARDPASPAVAPRRSDGHGGE